MIEEPSVAGPPAWASPVVLAKVDAVDGASVRISAPSLGRAAARLAAPGYRPVPGDRVLVAAADDGWRYVVGVIGPLRAAPEPTEGREVRASDGAHARVERTPEGDEVLALRDGEGRLLVSHHPSRGRTEIHAPGDLALRAGGDLSLEAEGTVRVRAGADLSLEGSADVALAATDLDGERRSVVSLREGRAQLTAEHLGASIDRADVAVAELNVVSRTIRSVAGRVRHEVERLEVHAGQIVERATESFRETEGLAQTRAGRLRLVARTTLSALADSALLKAREDVKIKGDKIYLA